MVVLRIVPMAEAASLDLRRTQHGLYCRCHVLLALDRRRVAAAHEARGDQRLHRCRCLVAPDRPNGLGSGRCPLGNRKNTEDQIFVDAFAAARTPYERQTKP